MKKIAIITPCILPVPAIYGGAVESLITKIIEVNEINKNYFIDLFTIDYCTNEKTTYSYTNLIKIKCSIMIKLCDKVLDKYYRTLKLDTSNRIFDNAIVGAFVDRLTKANEDYDLVIVENMMSTACKLARTCNGRYSFPVYFHMHNDIDIYRSPKMIQELTRYGVQFIAVSDYIRKQIINHARNPVVSLLYNGVKLPDHRKELQKSSDSLTLMYAGRIIPSKGVKELVIAFKSLVDSLEEEYRKQLVLEIVGFSGFDHGYENEIRRIVSGNENIICVDRVLSGEMDSLYDKADVVVMPTLNEEPFGLVALETMAKGIPLIVTDSGALPEVVGNGAYIVSRKGDIIANLLKAIKEVVFDEEYRLLLSINGYNRAHDVSDFDITNYYLNFSKIIQYQKIDSEDTISVIIPVYNVSPFLERCVTSVLDQTYRNIEIILVDDGSTDDSGLICDNYGKSDNRIKVIHQNNMGLSGARNTGINIASGRYIIFCDSDDYLKTDALEKMLKRLKRDNSDIVACGISSVTDLEEADGGKEDIITSSVSGRWSGAESVVQMMRTNNVCSVAWNKLYKKELFEGIRFPEGVYNEDEALIYKVLYKAKIVSYMPDALYMYYQRKSSIMHDDLVKRYDFFIKAIKDRIVFFREVGETELEQHSRITLLEWIKYSYRNIDDSTIKHDLIGIYNDNVTIGNVPSVMGLKKELALLLWKYCRY